jgi:hypothetical protein
MPVDSSFLNVVYDAGADPQRRVCEYVETEDDGWDILMADPYAIGLVRVVERRVAGRTIGDEHILADRSTDGLLARLSA